VEHIVICAHTKCSGVETAVSNAMEISQPLEGWLAQVHSVYRHHREELDAIKDHDDKVERLVHYNVIEQCKNIYRTAVVQQRLAENAAEGRPYTIPRIHGLVYDLATGYLKRVNWVTPEMEDPYDMAVDEDQADKHNIQKLLTNNAKWVRSKMAEQPDFFEKLGAAHEPFIMWIGSSDSRITAETITNTQPGEIFTHNNIGNLVMQADPNLQGGLQYAVDVLGVEHIVVCGSYDDPALAAALDDPTTFSPPLEGWLHHLADVYRLHAAEIDKITDEKAKLRHLVQLNVLEQCNNVAANSLVQSKQCESLANGAPYPVPRIHGFAYDPENGRLDDLGWSDEIHGSGADKKSLGFVSPLVKMFGK